MGLLGKLIIVRKEDSLADWTAMDSGRTTAAWETAVLAMTPNPVAGVNEVARWGATAVIPGRTPLRTLPLRGISKRPFFPIRKA